MRSKGDRVGAVVLAAGKSSRMGEAKQVLRLGERTLLEQTLRNVRAARVDPVVMVLGAAAEAIRAQLPAELLSETRLALNLEYETGMASSLRVGLAAVGSEVNAALIVLGDQPFVLPGTLDQVVGEYRRTRAQIVVPVHDGSRGNPVLLDWSLFGEAMALEGDVGCRAIFGKHPNGIVYVEVDDPGILMDIDSREDYESARQAYAERTQA
ncbi:MAG: nucleotidyltransferase family protein [Silvibacterium sp.]|nr:nucleotidyltransferase family protein [Silvibacterium sp.]